MRGTHHNRYLKLRYNTEQRCRSIVRAYPHNRGVVAQCGSAVALIENVVALIKEYQSTKQKVPVERVVVLIRGAYSFTVTPLLRSDLNEGSEPSPGRDTIYTIYWDLLTCSFLELYLYL